ncbi:unnamed protein product, partial [Phaeothamnion confervicola]
MDAGSHFAYAASLCSRSTIGLRALGASIRSTGTAHDLVVLVPPKADPRAVGVLRRDGWIVVASGASSGTAEQCSKIHAWALTEYDRVVVLDEDMLVLENIDDLFSCEGMCAVMEQSELINTALLVVTPNAAEYETLRRPPAAAAGTAAASPFFFAPGDAGFFNARFPNFAACAYYDPIADADARRAWELAVGDDLRAVDGRCHRLPTRYNGDLLLVMLNGGLGMVRAQNVMPDAWWETRRAKVVRFGLAELRPWHWQAAPFLPFVDLWERAAHAATAAEHATELRDHTLAWMAPPLACAMLCWLAWRLEAAVAAAAARGWARCRTVIVGAATGSGNGGGGNGGGGLNGGGGRRNGVGMSPRTGPARLRGLFMAAAAAVLTSGPVGLWCSVLHLVVGTAAVGAAAHVGGAAVPDDASPWLGWLIFLAWMFSLAPAAWAVYLRLMFLWGRGAAGGGGGSGSGDGNTCATPVGGATSAPRGFAGRAKRGGGSIGGSGGGLSGCCCGRQGGAPATEGIGAPPDPLPETAGCAAALVALMVALPAWKGLSGAASLGSVIGPAALLLVAVVFLFALCLLRQPVLW